MVKEALKTYFLKMRKFYNDCLGTEPSVSWDVSMDQTLFISNPDEDGEAQWRPRLAEAFSMNGLCEELCEFYGSYYYWQLRGKYRQFRFYFPAVNSKETAKKVAVSALKDGNYYFNGKNIVLLASCEGEGNDELLLFYRQDDHSLFVYDTDKCLRLELKISLAQLIDAMEVIL